MNPADHSPIITTGGMIIIAVIGAVQAVTIALIARQGKNTKAVRDQIVNHHPTQPNFREENDSRHAETRSWFRALFTKMVHLERRMSVVESQQDTLMTGFMENRSRIEDIEDTQSKENRS